MKRPYTADIFETIAGLDFEEDGFETEFPEAWQGEVNRTSRDYIRWVQSSLNRILGLRLAEDGRMGSQTRSAIRSFQQRQGLTADGIVGSLTEKALIAAGAGSQPSAVATSTHIFLGLNTYEGDGNRNWNWAQAKAQVPISFAIIRSNIGNRPDRVFIREWPRLKEAGIVRGAYLFLTSGRSASDPVTQAKTLIKTVGKLDKSDLPPTLDVEFPGGWEVTGRTRQQLLARVRTAWNVLKNHYGVAPIIYTSRHEWRDNLKNLPAPDLVESPLWLAEYRAPSAPRIPRNGVYDARVLRFTPPSIPLPWLGDNTNWWIHQYQGDAHKVPGFRQVDMNRFNTMIMGATGDGVKWVQRRLGIAQNGRFDAAMDSALRAFQRKWSLLPNGVVDPQTFAYLCWSNP
jgi:GH25 family lysozyme M1 (1,4-beta-N-acetylmuramidase)